jgi:hypothetical protein
MNQNVNTILNENLLSKITSAPSFYTIITIIVFLIIMLFLIIFNVKFSFSEPTKSQEKIIRDTFITLFSCILFFALFIMFFPFLKDFKQFLIQIQNAVYVILFTLFSILLYVYIPEDILKKYGAIINPAILGLGALSYYMSFSTNYTPGFNINYERIKTMILTLCLLGTLLTFYNVNTEGIFHSTSIIVIIVALAFVFLYTVILATMPSSSTSDANDSGVSLSALSSFGGYGSVLFLLFLSIMVGVIYVKKDSVFENKAKSAAIIIMLLVISILWTVLLGASIFSKMPNDYNLTDFANLGFLKSGLFAAVGLVISGLIIYLISTNIENLSSKSSITSFVLNIMLVVVVLALIYKTMNVELPYGNAKKNAFFGLIISIIFYIPCIVSSLFDSASQINPGTRSDYLMLIVSIALLIMYYYSYILLDKVNAQGGKQLISRPVSINRQYNLGDYISLNGTGESNYQYAISCWIYINSAPPNTNINYNKFTPILNYGEKPNISYNSSINTLRITMNQRDLKKNTTNKLLEFDDKDNRIVYESKDILLQKWNNIILNFNGGTLDIFLNGDLVKSSIEVSPYLTYDNLIVGEDGGILGGICNVIYFKKQLTMSNIYYLYNAVKNLSPPLLSNSKDVIVVKENE